MTEMTIEQAAWLRDVYLKPLELESATTARVLQAVPATAGDYRPDPASRGAMDLVRHIAAADIRFVDTVLNGEFNTRNLIPDHATTPSEIADWYSSAHAERRAALASLPGPALVKPVDFRGMFTWPAVRFLQMGLHHTIHHRGQLSAYLRSMGAKVPSIYGESYDAAQARLAAGKT